ncbi:MAG TPA: DNA alkylation repair protein [Gaiellaceae bacterium]|nr:DNA alkylation repair protein [Gaiellaceae bacterium]
MTRRRQPRPLSRSSRTVDEILSELRLAADPERVTSLKRAGAASPALGLGLPGLRALAKRIGRDHRLALALWQTPVRETRILASLIDEPERVTGAQMDRWAGSFDSWEICDQVCQNLFAHTPLAFPKALEWMGRSEEFVKRAAFVLIAVRAVHDERTDDRAFADLIPTVLAAADDDRPYVRKGASWALRQIGKRSDVLRARVVDTVTPGIESDSRGVRWVARDVTRELVEPGPPQPPG